MYPKLRRIIAGSPILLATLIGVILFGMVAPVFAYVYSATYTVTENASTSYDMLGVWENSNNTWMAANGFMEADALDTRIETLSGLEKPHMVTDNRTFTAIPVPADSQTNLYFTTGSSDLSSFYIIPGYGGYFTVADNATIEPSDNFSIELNDAWINTDAGADKYLFDHNDATNGGIRTFVSPTDSENVTARIYGVTTHHYSTFGTAADGQLAIFNEPVYADAQSAAVADAKDDTAATAIIGQFDDGDFNIWRSYFYFDTSPIPPGATVISANVSLYGSADNSDTDFDITIMNGQPTYPSDILATSDYDITHYSGNGGSLTTVGFNIAGYNHINLNATGLSWINLEGTTKLCILSSRDMAITEPTGSEYITVYTANETGTAKDPYISIIYSLPSVLADASATGVTTGEHDIKVSQVDNTGSGWLAGWDNRIRFDVDADKVDEDVTHFPMLVHLSTSAGIGSDDVSAVFDEIGANYLKLAITQADGTTEIYVEVEEWDDTGEEAWLWASSNTTTLSSTNDTTFYLYFDNDHADNTAYVGVPNDVVVHNVWDANFVLVDHMGDDGDNASTYDSTSNNNDGTKKGANEPIEATGKVGEAQDFDGVDDKVEHPAIDFLAGDAWTAEVLLIEDAADTMIAIMGGGTDTRSSIGYRDTNRLTWYGGTTATRVNGPIVTNRESYGVSAISYNNGILYMYRDGVESGPYNLSEPMKFDSLGSPKGLGWLAGLLDEVRISDIARSAAWIKATYNTCWDNFIDFIPHDTVAISEYSYDFCIYIDSTLKDRTLGVSVPNSTADWTFMKNDVNDFFPYCGNITMEIDGVLQAVYNPNDIISGTTLPDRQGTAQDGTFSWGSNPTGVTVAIGSMASSGQPAIGADVTEPPQDILHEVEVSDWFTDPNLATLATNPLRPFVTIMSDTTTLTELQAWRLLGLAFVLFVAVGTVVTVRRHLLIAGIATSAAILLLVVWTIWPMWTLVFIIGCILAGIIAERSPAV